MATVISELYDAFVESRFTKIEQQILELKGRVDLLTWMAGFNLVLTVGVLFKVFNP